MYLPHTLFLSCQTHSSLHMHHHVVDIHQSNMHHCMVYYSPCCAIPWYSVYILHLTVHMHDSGSYLDMPYYKADHVIHLCNLDSSHLLDHIYLCNYLCIV